VIETVGVQEVMIEIVAVLKEVMIKRNSKSFKRWVSK